jgi:hypothetical protein
LDEKYNILMQAFLNRDETIGPMRPIAIFADQLTVEPTRGIHETFWDGDAPEERFEGVFGAISDFHEKMNFLQVIFTLSTVRFKCPLIAIRVLRLTGGSFVELLLLNCELLTIFMLQMNR